MEERMKILFVGGTGNISASVSRLALQRGFEVYLLNRGKRGVDIPGATSIVADINKPDEVKKALGNLTFDSITNWIAFTPADIERDIELFSGRTNQYIFISSASVYQKPATSHVITESTPLVNPHWEYSRNKIACEDRLMQELRANGFPGVIVRPSLTYGERLIPLVINSWGKSYTVVDRMKHGERIIVPGDGASLWTITHSDDFAKAFVGLMGHQQSIGHAFHITSDEVMTWDQYYREVGRAVGVTPKIVHLPSEFIMAFAPGEEGSLLGDKSVSTVFDNSKVKRFVPDYTATITWAQGIRRSLAWFETEKGRIQIDDGANALWDKMLAAYDSAVAQAA
jgi:nucleoside-diphosphate-sugar epimerase